MEVALLAISPDFGCTSTEHLNESLPNPYVRSDGAGHYRLRQQRHQRSGRVPCGRDAAGVGNSGRLPAQRPASICDATLPGCGERYRDCCRGR